jgi:uncharacterized membrane protein YczE
MILNKTGFIAYFRNISLPQWLRLGLGLTLFGISSSIMVRANVGLGSWDVFGQGIAKQLDIRFGTAAILVGALIMVLWVWLRLNPGVGTVANILWIGMIVNWTLPLFPEQTELLMQYVSFGFGIVLMGFATALYLSAKLGSGPRDGLMLGLSRKMGWSVRRTRTTIEIIVLITGWLMGGTVGIGTVLFAVTIGPVIQFMMRQMK